MNPWAATVYVVCDSASDCLYVGMSGGVGMRGAESRLKVHRKTAWGGQIATVSVVTCPSRTAAFKLENALQMALRPRYCNTPIERREIRRAARRRRSEREQRARAAA